MDPGIAIVHFFTKPALRFFSKKPDFSPSVSFRLVRELSSRSRSAGEFPNHSMPVTETMPHGSQRPHPHRPIPHPLTSPTLPEDEGPILVTAFMAVRCLDRDTSCCTSSCPLVPRPQGRGKTQCRREGLPPQRAPAPAVIR